MKEDIEKLKQEKNTARELLDKSKELKSKIDEIKSKLNEKKQNKLNLADEMTNVIDEEEVKLLEELKIVIIMKIMNLGMIILSINKMYKCLLLCL